MTSAGILAYDLAGNWCGSCGMAKWNRMLMAGCKTGCAECDAVTTRHRCTGRPDIEDVDGQWTCRDCGSIWRPITVTEPCGDCCAACGHVVEVRRLEVTEGDRIGSAPAFVASWPFGIEPWSALACRRPRAAGPGKCHVTPGGISVHVKPDCRCRR